MNAFSRTELLFGADAMERLAKARVAVFGVGGVGGYAVEALVRSGVGALDLVDDDTVCESNLNRQIIATRATIGMPKVDAAEERIRLLNPDCRVTKHQKFYLPETAGEFDFSQYDYVIDAIDTVSGKLGLAEQAYAAARRSSVRWVQETSWTRRRLKWQILCRHRFVRWHVSCGVS